MLPHKFRRALQEPGAAVELLVALAKGRWLKVWYPLRGIRFAAGSNLKIFGSLRVRGPGRVVLGDNVVIGMHVDLYTHSKDAVLSIGNGCFINGARMSCTDRVELGDRCILAECRVMDSHFHSTRSDRWNPEAPVRVAPVILARNVWVAADVGVLAGAQIGENSVIGFGAVCAGVVPANELWAGNPIRRVRAIEVAAT
jgi:acetyltransferase-like isoleucine patch superfamily enzyme